MPQALADHITSLLGLLLLLGFSGFFSSSETAVFNLGWDDLRRLRKLDSRTSLLVMRLHTIRTELIVTILFGNMVVNILYFSLATHWAFAVNAEKTASNSMVASAAALGFFALVLVGEIFPKMLAISHPTRHSMRIAWPLYGLHRVLSVTRVVPMLGRVADYVEKRLWRETNSEEKTAAGAGEPLSVDELLSALDMSDDIPAAEKQLLREIIRLDDRVVRELITPRTKIAFAARDDSPEKALGTAVENSVRTLPVTGGSMDDIVGMVRLSDLMAARARGDKNLAAGLQPVELVPETMPVTELMRSMREEHFRFAVVVDEYGQTAGVVTLTDCLEAVFGEISDEYDTEPDKVRIITPSAALLGGALPVRKWADKFSSKLEVAGVDVSRLLEGPYDTMSGLIIERLQRMPRAGDTVHFGPLTFIVRETNPPGAGAPVKNFLQVIRSLEKASEPGNERSGEAEDAG